MESRDLDINKNIEKNYTNQHRSVNMNFNQTL